MSNQSDFDVEATGRSIEPWLGILLVALVPLVLAVFLPESWRIPFYVVGGAICAGGLLLLVKQEVKGGE
jgi:hypothetical protein